MRNKSLFDRSVEHAINKKMMAWKLPSHILEGLGMEVTSNSCNCPLGRMKQVSAMRKARFMDEQKSRLFKYFL